MVVHGVTHVVAHHWWVIGFVLRSFVGSVMGSVNFDHQMSYVSRTAQLPEILGLKNPTVSPCFTVPFCTNIVASLAPLWHCGTPKTFQTTEGDV